MTEKYLKFIAKSPYKEQIENFLQDLGNHDIQKYDIKKLSGQKDMYRVRIGKIRCIFQKINNEYYISRVTK